MTAAIEALKGARLPMLRRLWLMDIEKLSKAHRLFGTIGEISHVFQIAPAMDKLRLHGNFTPAEPTHYKRLAVIEVEVDDTGATGGPLDQRTVFNLMLPDLPGLAHCDLDLSDDPPEFHYHIPDAFLPPQHFPLLQSLAINSLTAKSAIQLEDWQAKQGMG